MAASLHNLGLSKVGSQGAGRFELPHSRFRNQALTQVGGGGRREEGVGCAVKELSSPLPDFPGKKEDTWFVVDPGSGRKQTTLSTETWDGLCPSAPLLYIGRTRKRDPILIRPAARWKAEMFGQEFLTSENGVVLP